MVLPSVADTLVVIILLIPGFVAFFLTRRISAIGRKFSDLEITVWSIFFSLLIYIPFSLWTGLDNLDAIRDGIFSPRNFLRLIICTVAAGAVLGSVMKLFRRGILAGSSWDLAVEKMRQKKGGFVIVYTENGLEYKGLLHYAGVAETARELIVRKPKLILRDKDWNVLDEIEMGAEILFTEKDIRRVLFYDEL